MRKTATIVMLILLISNVAVAEIPGSSGTSNLMLKEMGASCGLSYALGIGLYAIGGDGKSRINLLSGFFVGSVAGVLLVGEIADGQSGNPQTTFLVTALGALVPIVIARVIEGPVYDIYADGWGDTPSVGYIAVPLICAPICTVLYNIVKKPEEETLAVEARFNLLPTINMVSDSGGKAISTFGVELSF